MPEAADNELIDPDAHLSQRKFAALIGSTSQGLNQWINEGRLPRKGSLRDYMHALYAMTKARVGRPAAPKPEPAEGDDDKLDLTQEKAALARTQRLIQEVKLAAARKEYAPIGLLGDVLAAASGAVVAQFDQLEGRLAKSCPDMPELAKMAVLQTIAQARNAWIHETAELIKTQIESQVDEEDEA